MLGPGFGAEDGVLDGADDLPAGGCGVVRGGQVLVEVLVEVSGEVDGAPGGAGDAVEGEGVVLGGGSGCGGGERAGGGLGVAGGEGDELAGHGEGELGELLEDGLVAVGAFRRLA